MFKHIYRQEESTTADTVSAFQNFNEAFVDVFYFLFYIYIHTREKRRFEDLYFIRRNLSQLSYFLKTFADIFVIIGK